MDRHALIVGGGIGGLAAGVALRRVGIDATVFERAPEIREVGAALSLWSNAVIALRRLGLDQKVAALGSEIERVQTRADTGKLINDTDIGAIGRRAGALSVCAHRADLQRVLAEALDPSAIKTGHTCTSFERDGEGVTVRFAEGGSQRGAFLIGADGVRSAVRDQLLGKTEPRYAGYVAWRGMARFEHSELPPGLAVFGLGRGTQMGLFHCGPGRVYWFITRNGPPGSIEPAGGHKKELLDTFRDWFALLPAAVEATEESAILKSDVIDRPPAWPWGEGRVTLLGDAVHSTTPNLGQGACQALESAVVLADSLRHQGDIAAGLRDYEARRRDRTALVTKQSWTLGKMFQWQNLLAVRLRNFLSGTWVGRRHGMKLFEQLLTHQVPELPGL